MNYAQYIGLEYHPENFHCWHFFQQIQREAFGRHLPEVMFDAQNLRSIAKKIQQHALSKQWQKLKEPIHGCAVLLGKAAQPIHVGCWLKVDQGGVIHNQQGIGVIFQKPPDLQLNGWHIAGLYQPNFL